MTKDLSYAGSKNQIFLLAFSFVASRAPCPPLSTLAPGWKPSLHLSYCLKPKFTVFVGGKDPLLPLPQGLGVLPTSLLLFPPPKEKGEGRILPPTLGCFLGALQTPAEDQVPIMLGVWIPAGELEKLKLHRPPMGDPQPKAMDWV